MLVTVIVSVVTIPAGSVTRYTSWSPMACGTNSATVPWKSTRPTGRTSAMVRAPSPLVSTASAGGRSPNSTATKVSALGVTARAGRGADAHASRASNAYAAHGTILPYRDGVQGEPIGREQSRRVTTSFITQ